MTQMPFDPFKRRPINSKPHVVTPATGPGPGPCREAHCINCGATGWDILINGTACDPDSEKAKTFRRAKSDAMVGRATGSSV